MTEVHVELLEEHPLEGKPLGRHVEHDPRSWDYAIEAEPESALRAVSWHRRGSAFNQGNLGSCTGNAIAGALNTAPFQPTEPHLMTEADAVSIYEAATIVDGIPGVYPPDDTGSSGLAVCKVAKSRGLIAGYKHAFSLSATLTALQKGPIIVGVPWYEGFDNPDPSGMVEIAGQVRGGHEFEIHAFDPASAIVEAWQSWGIHWGLHGRFRFLTSTLGELLSQRGDATFPIVKPSA